MLQERALVELEVRRADHRDRVGTRLGSVRSERDGVGGGLGAAVDGDLKTGRRRRDEELECALPLLGAEQEALAGRAEGEQPVEPGRGEKVDVRGERVLVEIVAVERRHGGGQSSSEHAPTLTGRPAISAGRSTPPPP